MGNTKPIILLAHCPEPLLLPVRSKPFTCNYEDKLNEHSICNNPVKYELRIQVDTGAYAWIAFCGRHARSIARTTGAKRHDVRPVKVIR